MLNITCTFCRAPINLSDGDLAMIMQKVGSQRPKSAPVTCPTCRRSNKVPMQRLQQAYRLAGSPETPQVPAQETAVEGSEAPPAVEASA